MHVEIGVFLPLLHNLVGLEVKDQMSNVFQNPKSKGQKLKVRALYNSQLGIKYFT